MSHLAKLLHWDIILLHRNMLIFISAVVAAVYVGIFYLMQPLGSLDFILALLIFNDPVVTCYIFAAVLWLYDKNQNILQAVSVLPLKIEIYLISKILILSSLATIMALIMALATNGFNFNLAHLVLSVFLSGFIFASLGFVIGANSKNFNQFLLYSIPFLILAGLPFLRLLGIGEIYYFAWLPSTGGIELLYSAIDGANGWQDVLMISHLLIFCYLSWKLCIRTVQKKML
jgi:fluoroquinolone transport system permease protein